MSALSASTIANLAAAAGFPSSIVPTAVAIALAESSGNPNAVNPSDPGGSYGLWQINLGAHPEFANANLMDPQTNANAAFQVYLEQGFGAWSTYTSGAYMRYLSAAGVTAALTIAPTTSTLSIPAVQQASIFPADTTSLWSSLALAAGIIFGIGFVLSEE